MYAHVVPPMDRSLVALSGLLARGAAHCEAKGIKPEALLTFRLFPDMFPFTRQVQLSCDFATRAAARLAGVEPQGFPDTETSFAELADRVATARAYIASFAPEAFAGAAERVVTLKVRGQEMSMPGLQFLTVFAVPQFYFHVTTAYNILRHNGVEIGKMDYMGA